MRPPPVRWPHYRSAGWLPLGRASPRRCRLLGRGVGAAGQDALWDLVADGSLTLRDASAAEVARMAELMHTYRDLPMDLADASVVAAAEATGERRVFTFDGHFRVYVLADGSALEVVP